MEVCFFDAVSDDLLKFAVIVSRHEGKWVFCRHRDRTTWECPGGHRESGEAVADTARRDCGRRPEPKNSPSPPSAFIPSGTKTARPGMLCFAEISAFGDLPPLEIQEVRLFDRLPENWTYPQIQPCLFRKIRETVGISD
jgi:8-oxo-dGTP diphosphatase